MTRAFEVITRGVDSSGRTVRGTRQNFEFFDRVNAEAAGGILVIVQGSFSFASASAGTHSKAMCMDYRTWNLTSAVRERVVRRGRDLMGTMWYRTTADGFDPHIHNNLIGDWPAHWTALNQVADYRKGLNGLANKNRDRNPYRPKKITNYIYLGDDDMYFEKEDRERLIRIEKALQKEKRRDQREAARDKARFQRMVSALGSQADQLTLLINKTKDDATKNELRKMKEAILLQLKNDPDVREMDNPSDDALDEMNMG